MDEGVPALRGGHPSVLGWGTRVRGGTMIAELLAKGNTDDGNPLPAIIGIVVVFLFIRAWWNSN